MGNKNTNVTVASFLRPRGFLILLAGGCFSIAFALFVKWWLLFAGIIFSFAGYGWSVNDSMNDRKFIEAMSKKALSASVSDEAKIEVLAHTGSRFLVGSEKEQMKKIAEKGLNVIKSLDGVPFEYSEHLKEVPKKISSVVVSYEKLAIAHSKLKEDGSDSDRLTNLAASLVKTSELIDTLQAKAKLLCEDESDSSNLPEITASIVSELEAIEDVEGELKLLE